MAACITPGCGGEARGKRSQYPCNKCQRAARNPSGGKQRGKNPNARHKLAALNGQRLRFAATLERRGSKPAFRGPDIPTLLLVDVCDYATGEQLTAHLWIAEGKWAKSLPTGRRFAFDARVDRYEKGYRGYRDDVYDAPPETDWHLERPTRIVLLPEKNIDEVNE